MSVCWVFLVLLGFGSSHAIKCLSTCPCDDQVIIACVSDGEKVSVPCPIPVSQEVEFSLYKGKEKIAAGNWHFQNNSRQTEKISTVKTSVYLHMDETGSLNFVLPASPGRYSCIAQTIFPPPILSMHNASKILVNMQGHGCNCSADSDPLIQHEVKTHEPYLWILIPVLAAVSVYSLIVSIIAFVSWRKLKTAESNSDYMNTKPRAPKGHRKRGVQHPVPRHF